jgi:hypothetical protein
MPARITKEELQKLLNAKVPNQEIAKRYGVGRTCVVHWKRKFNLAISPKERIPIKVIYSDFLTEGME